MSGCVCVYMCRCGYLYRTLCILVISGPTFDKRKQNTIEKMLDNLKKDEKTLQLMMEQSITLHTPHQVHTLTKYTSSHSH